jgi:hypothetical protein
MARELLLRADQMRRILVVLRGPISIQTVRQCCMGDLPRGSEVAICHVLPKGHDGIGESVRAQREITSALRVVLGDDAESFIVLVASEGEVEECARQWGATVVHWHGS